MVCLTLNNCCAMSLITDFDRAKPLSLADRWNDNDRRITFWKYKITRIILYKNLNSHGRRSKFFPSTLVASFFL